MLKHKGNFSHNINSDMLLEIAKEKFVKVWNADEYDDYYWINKEDVQADFAPFSTIGDKKGTISMQVLDIRRVKIIAIASYDLTNQSMEVKCFEEKGYAKFKIQVEEAGNSCII